MLVPLSPVPVPIYPAGIQGALVLRNISDTDVSVSALSAPGSGFALDPGGSLEWPSETPLYAYGETGAYLSVGAGSGLTATPYVAAPIVNVTTPDPVVVVTPAPTTGTGDEDDVRSYTSAQIAALTAADKATNFVIYNTDTARMMLCVNNNVIPAPVSDAQSSGSFSTTSQTIATASNAAAVTVTLPVNLASIMFWGSSDASAGLWVAKYAGDSFNNHAVTSYPGAGGTNPAAVKSSKANTDTGSTVVLPFSIYGAFAQFQYDVSTGNLTYIVRNTRTNAAETIPAVTMNWVGIAA